MVWLGMWLPLTHAVNQQTHSKCLLSAGHSPRSWGQKSGVSLQSSHLSGGLWCSSQSLEKRLACFLQSLMEPRPLLTPIRVCLGDGDFQVENNNSCIMLKAESVLGLLPTYSNKCFVSTYYVLGNGFAAGSKTNESAPSGIILLSRG